MSNRRRGAARRRRGSGAYAPSGGFRKGMFGVSGSGDTSGFGGLVRVEPGGAVALHSTDRPYGGWFDEVADALAEAVGQEVYDAAVERVARRPRRDHLVRPPRAPADAGAGAARRRRRCASSCCSSVSGVDYLDSGGPAAAPTAPAARRPTT